jgi:hypothetical protein
MIERRNKMEERRQSIYDEIQIREEGKYFEFEKVKSGKRSDMMCQI